MTEIASLLQIAAGILLVAAPIILLVTVLRGDEPAGLDSLWSAPDIAPWPFGVQEEEPMPWGAPAAGSAS